MRQVQVCSYNEVFFTIVKSSEVIPLSFFNDSCISDENEVSGGLFYPSKQPLKAVSALSIVAPSAIMYMT